MLEHLRGERRELDFPDFRADALNARIIQGYDFTVSLLGDSSTEPEVERLRNLPEVWVICYRTPSPGWRLIGRLYAKGSFVAVGLKDRRELADTPNYHRIAEASANEMDEIFRGRFPHLGETVADYFYGIPRNVDKPAIY